MMGLYFSGTGNTRHCVETFLGAYDPRGRVFSIEEAEALPALEGETEVVFGCPVQFSALPKIVGDYIEAHSQVWAGKRVFVLATMGLFSGDGAGVLARRLERYGAVILGGLHLKMPDSICDERALKRPLEGNRALVVRAGEKAREAAQALRAGTPPREGLGPLSRMAGLFGQRLYFGHKTRRYSDKLKIDGEKCRSCGKCAGLCPMENLTMEGKVPRAAGRCTMCYRCISQCPAQAITLLGKAVVEQTGIENYL